MNDEQATTRWYVRRSATVQGPYTADEIKRYLLLGRIRLSDRVSVDERCWQSVTQCPDLIPDEMQDLGSEAGRARFEAARRAIDERSVDRESEQTGARTEADVGPRQPAQAPLWRPGVLLALLALLAVAVALAALGYYREFTGGLVRATDCAAPAAADAAWSGCTKDGVEVGRGADLSHLHAINASLRGAQLVGVDLRAARLDYVNLSRSRLNGANLREAVLTGADLSGASLVRADLRSADLRNADLRNADLRNAKLDHARLEHASLGNALWTNGRSCAADSVGTCR